MLVCVFLCTYCTRDRGCSAHPVFPAPSVFQEGAKLMKTSGESRRENASACRRGSLTIESEIAFFPSPLVGEGGAEHRMRGISPRVSPTCAESGPFLDSTEIGASQINGLRRTNRRFDDVVPTYGVDANQPA